MKGICFLKKEKKIKKAWEADVYRKPKLKTFNTVLWADEEKGKNPTSLLRILILKQNVLIFIQVFHMGEIIFKHLSYKVINHRWEMDDFRRKGTHAIFR